MLQQNRRVNVSELSQTFHISQVSIRHDLDYLERIGVALRVHGGARLSPALQQMPQFDARLLKDVKAKAAIGKAAAGLILPGQTILLDSGTTVLEVARNIPPPLLEDGDLTVVTRSLAIASELRKYRRIRLVVLGGMYLSEYDAFVGAQVEQALQGLHVHTLFIGTEGILPERGLTSDNLLEANLYPHLAKVADQVVVVAGSAKFGVNKLQTMLPTTAIQCLITDCNTAESYVQALREIGVEVTVVPC